MKYIAVIGTRNPDQEQQDNCFEIVNEILNLGYGIVTGGAGGIDQLSMDTVNALDPRRLLVVLPWASFEKEKIHPNNKVIVYNPKEHKHWADSVYEYHPSEGNLRSGAFRLHARNYGIVENAVAVVAFSSDKPAGGGTGQGLRIATSMLIPLVDNPDIDDFREMLIEDLGLNINL